MGLRTKGKKVKIGIIQVEHIISEKPECKYKQLLELAENCLKNGAELVFFPEAFQYTDDRSRSVLKHPDELIRRTNDWKKRCSELAKKYNSYVVPWDYEIDENGNIYNSSYILDRNGIEIGRYRKCHLTYNETKKYGLSHGDEFKVFDLDFGKVGIMICFDNYFPESARILGTLGAELVLYPLYGDTLNPQWEIKLRARAMDNSMYIAATQISMNAMDKLNVYSGIVDPYGNTICRMGEKRSWQVVEIEMGKQVITNLSGVPEKSEDLRKYLERSRNTKAYKPLLNEIDNIWTWEDIYSD